MSKRKEAICDSFCKGCVFNGYFNGNTLSVCEYFLRTGMRRPCPAGTGCTVKQTGNRKTKWRYQNDQTWEIRAKRQREMMHKVCPCCGTEFDTMDPRKIYCSRKCNMRKAQRAWRKRQEEQNGEKE